MNVADGLISIRWAQQAWRYPSARIAVTFATNEGEALNVVAMESISDDDCDW